MTSSSTPASGGTTGNSLIVDDNNDTNNNTDRNPYTRTPLTPGPEDLQEDPSQQQISTMALSSESESYLKQILRNSAHSQKFICGLASGVITALAFNPWDRALYLSVIHQRPFFNIENWRHPFVGSSQSMVIRTISGSMFFPLKEFFDEKIISYARTKQWNQDSLWISFFSGNLAGAVNGIALNSINAVKYHTWSTQKGFLGTVKYIYKEAGITPFLRGQSATVVRDTIFGGAYAILKHFGENFLRELQERHKNQEQGLLDTVLSPLAKESNETIAMFLISFLAATGGTMASAPLNYTRNHMFGTKPGDRIPTSREILRDLWRDTMNQHEMNKIRYISMRFRLGAATTRVGCGMAVGQVIYDAASRKLRALSETV